MKRLKCSHDKVLDYKLNNEKSHITKNAASQLLVATQEHTLAMRNANLHLKDEQKKFHITMEEQILDSVTRSKLDDKKHSLEIKAVKDQLKDGVSILKNEIQKSKLDMKTKLKDEATKLKDEINKNKLEMEASRREGLSVLKDQMNKHNREMEAVRKAGVSSLKAKKKNTSLR